MLIEVHYSYGLETYTEEDAESGKECMTNMAMCIWQEECHFYFIRDGFYETKF